MFDKTQGIENFIVYVSDWISEAHLLKSHFGACNDFINKAFRTGGKVLVHWLVMQCECNLVLQWNGNVSVTHCSSSLSYCVQEVLTYFSFGSSEESASNCTPYLLLEVLNFN